MRDHGVSLPLQLIQTELLGLAANDRSTTWPFGSSKRCKTTLLIVRSAISRLQRLPHNAVLENKAQRSSTLSPRPIPRKLTVTIVLIAYFVFHHRWVSITKLKGIRVNPVTQGTGSTSHPISASTTRALWSLVPCALCRDGRNKNKPTAISTTV